jgi:hypothetical protein
MEQNVLIVRSFEDIESYIVIYIKREKLHQLPIMI